MVGSSMMMASFGFMIYAISPAYSNSNSDKTEIINTNAPVGSNGVISGNDAYFVDGGYVYKCNDLVSSPQMWKYKASSGSTYWEKFKLP